MRLPMTPEMKEMYDKIEPYKVRNGMEVKLADDTPNEIRELDKKFKKLSKQQWEDAMKVM